MRRKYSQTFAATSLRSRNCRTILTGPRHEPDHDRRRAWRLARHLELQLGCNHETENANSKLFRNCFSLFFRQWDAARRFRATTQATTRKRKMFMPMQDYCESRIAAG